MFFQVDVDLCTQDELCVLECPAKILQMNEHGPTMVDGGDEICIRCGHCVAVCPVAAVSLEFLSPSDCLEVQDALMLSEEGAEHFLRSRRSIRTYKKKPLEKDLLEKALNIAAAAPTGSNKQPVKWLVFTERKDVEIITRHVTEWMRYVIGNHPEVATLYNMEKIVGDMDNGVDRICRNAPQLIFTYAAKEAGLAGTDCHSALAYLELALPALGAGSCWAGYVLFAASQWPPLSEFLGLSDEYQLHGAVMAGYPKFRYTRIPPRNPAEIVYR